MLNLSKAQLNRPGVAFIDFYCASRIQISLSALHADITFTACSLSLAVYLLSNITFAH